MSELLLPLRVLQGVLALMVLSLSVYVANWYNAYTLTASPNEVNYLIFVSLFTFLSIAYLELTPRYAKRASHPYLHLIVEVITSIFHLTGFIALSVFLARLLFCRGSVCAAARADIFFSVASWASWVTTTVMLWRDIADSKSAKIKRSSLGVSSTPMETAEIS